MCIANIYCILVHYGILYTSMLTKCLYYTYTHILYTRPNVYTGLLSFLLCGMTSSAIAMSATYPIGKGKKGLYMCICIQ